MFPQIITQKEKQKANGEEKNQQFFGSHVITP
jgi:hypothetical protein